MSLADQPAFPAKLEQSRDPAGVYTTVTTFSGMTYRQWLVGMALEGILANKERSPLGLPAMTVAKDALAFADAAIRAQEASAPRATEA